VGVWGGFLGGVFVGLVCFVRIKPETDRQFGKNQESVGTIAIASLFAPLSSLRGEGSGVRGWGLLHPHPPTPSPASGRGGVRRLG
jgi:hypothetical protein